MTEVLTLLLALCTACVGVPEEVQPCTVVEAARQLPEAVRETSGIALSSFDAGTLWTHNDANNAPYLYAVDRAGALTAQVRVTGAELIDWEDIESASCVAGTCLYVGDIGDNNGDRAGITIYEVQEPQPGATESAPARAIHARYPDRAQDAEALFLVDGVIHIITKGRHGAVSLYRVPAGEGTVTLELVRELMPQPENDADRVTAATTSPDGEWVAIRTYRTLYFLRAANLIGGQPLEPVTQDLTALDEQQGEGVAMAADGTVWLTSEAENRRFSPTRSILRCTLPAR